MFSCPVAVSSLFFPLQIFGFLASFLCLASLWLSYKITCITQSSGKLGSSECRACEVEALSLAQQHGPEWSKRAGDRRRKGGT